MEDITITAWKCDEKVEVTTTKAFLAEILNLLAYDGYRKFDVR